jgi:hypothetical protein
MLYKCLLKLYKPSLTKEQFFLNNKKKRFFKLQNSLFFLFFSFWPLLLHQCITFSCLVQIEQFKLFWNFHLKLYKSSCNFKGNKIIFKDFLSGLEIGYELFDRKCFVKTTPPTLRGHNFLTSNPFLLISNATDAPKRSTPSIF